MNTFKDLMQKLDCVVPLIYVVAPDEHATLVKINAALNPEEKRITTDVSVYKSTFGIQTFTEYMKEIDDRALKTNDNQEINNALEHIYKRKPDQRREVFIMTEADAWINDDQIIRRIKDIAINCDENEKSIKTIILISSTLNLPAKLEKYTQVVFLPYPSEDDIKATIEHWLGGYNKSIKETSKKIEVKTDSETVNALKGLTVIQMRANITTCIKITEEAGARRLDASILNTLKREVVNKTSMLQIVDSKVTFDDVGGYSRVKNWLRKSGGGWTNEGKAFGLPMLKGMLALGLPGCGKTELAKGLANEWKLNLVKFDPSNVFSSRVGDSEANMEKAIGIIESLAPCVLLIDEMEKGFAGMQSSSFSDAGTTARVIGKFLMWMQDSEAAVFTIATVNHIQFLPPELISRFDEVYFFKLPSAAERKSIINIQIKKFGMDPKDFNLDALAEACPGLAGREIMQAVKESMYDAFHSKGKKMTSAILENVLKNKTPVMKTMEEQLKFAVNWVGYDKERKDGIRARFANDELDAEDINEFLKMIEEGKTAKGDGIDWNNGKKGS